jgi:uncharacterized protein
MSEHDILCQNGSRTIRTYMGKYMDVFAPTPEMICIEDIAHALSNNCRWANQLPNFYSVAQHSIYVSKHVPDQDAFSALLHDATEAYLPDMPRPIKLQIPNFKEIENGLMMAIAEKFGVKFPFSEAIHKADEEAMEWEYKNLMIGPTMESYYLSMNPQLAETQFLLQYQKLINKR